MTEALVIRLPLSNAADETPQAQWMLVDAQQHRMGAVVTGSLQEAGALAAHRKVFAVVNGAAVLHTEPVLPPLKGGTKLAQVVPFALEDQLATDVDELHFAIGKRSARPGTPIAVVAHRQIQQWLHELQNAGLYPAALYTDTSSVPASHDGITLLLDQGRILMRNRDNEPVSLDISPLDEALRLLLPDSTEIPVTVFVPEAEYDQHQASIDTLRARAPHLQVKLLPEGSLPLFAAQVLQGDNLNLLQGAYEPRRDMRAEFKPWRTAALFVGVLFALHLAVTATHWWQLRREEKQLDQQITATYVQGIPGATSINPADARHAFESRLIALQTNGVANPLMEGLAALADAIDKTPDSHIEDLSYRDNLLNVRMMVSTVDALDQVRKLASAHGLSVEIQSANPRDKQIEGRLQLKSGNAH